MIAELLLSQWKLVLIVTLIGLLTLQTHRLANEEKEHDADNTLYRLLTAEAQRKTRAAEAHNAQTVKEINDEKPKLVAQAERNAAELYRRRYGRPEGSVACAPTHSSSGLGISGMPDVSSTSYTGTIQADSTSSTERAPAIVDAGGTCDPRFLNEAARAAVVIKQWNDFADREGLPREKQND